MGLLGLTGAFAGCEPGALTTGGGAVIVLGNAPPAEEDARTSDLLDAAEAPPPEDAAELPLDVRQTAPPRDAARPPPPRDAAPLPPDAGPPEHCAGGPLAAPIPGCRPAVPRSTGDPAQDCVNRVNQFRAECQCLPPLRRWVAGEACANTHAEYDSTRGPHAGFSGRICPESGFGQNECPGYNDINQVIQVCLQQMWDEGPGDDFQRHGHYLNMTNPRFSQVACGFYDGPQTGMWAVQNYQ